MVYFKTQFFTFLPIAATCFIFIFWRSKKGNINKSLPSIIISILLTIDFIHPSIINSMVDSLSCVDIDQQSLLKIDYFYVCFTQDHFINVIIIIIINLVISPIIFYLGLWFCTCFIYFMGIDLSSCPFYYFKAKPRSYR